MNTSNHRSDLKSPHSPSVALGDSSLPEGVFDYTSKGGYKMVNSSLIYIKKDGKYLMLHRVKKKNDMNHDKWIGIGGKFEHGESPEDCVRRETREETGLILGKVEYRGIITFVLGDETEYMHLFTSNDFSGRMKEVCDEGNPEWVEISEVYKLPIWEGDKIFLKLIERDETPFFSMKLVYENDILKEHILY